MYQFFFHAGDAPKIESVHAVALYDPADGVIRHMHYVVSMSDSPKVDTKTVEKEAISDAKKFGLTTDKFQVIHSDDVDLTSAYRVNVKTKQLEKIPESEVSKKG